MMTTPTKIRRALATALAATAVGVGTVATAATPAAAATKNECATVARYNSYAARQASAATDEGEAVFWIMEVLANEEWLSANC